MAQKRMFSLSVVDTDTFLEMPISARLLYYDLGMRADDDGFVDNWKKILLFTGLKEDDVKILIAKQFIIPFETGVIVIKHWRMNNYLQKDRTKPTVYQNELKSLIVDENNVYSLDTTCIQKSPQSPENIDVYKMDTTCIHSIEENSIEENSIDKSSCCDIDNLDFIDRESATTNLFEFVEKIFGRPLGGTEYEIIGTWNDNEVTRYAIKQAELARAFNVRYIQRILESYKRENIKTVAEAEEREKKFHESKTTVRNQTLSKSEQYRLEDERLREKFRKEDEERAKGRSL